MSQDETPRLTAGAGPRLPELDVLRGLAALSVVLYHYIERYDVIFHHADAPAFRWRYGYYGVQLFFMLSGWVIPLAADRIRDGAAFAWGRFARLYPTYWAVCLFTYLAVVIVRLPSRGLPWWQALVNVTMLQEVVDLRNIDGVYWSLQVELTFYAAVLALLWRGRLRWLGPVLLGWTVVGMALPPALRALSPAAAAMLVPHLERIFILEWVHLFGLGYVFYRLTRGAGLGALGAALLGLGLWRQTQVSLPGSALLLAGFALVFWGVHRGALPWLAWRPLAALGAVSYPLYLVHSNPGYLIIRGLEARGVGATLAIGVALTTALALAALLHRLVEDPARAALRAHGVPHRWGAFARGLLAGARSVGAALRGLGAALRDRAAGARDALVTLVARRPTARQRPASPPRAPLGT